MTKTMNSHEEIDQNRLPNARKGSCAAVFIDVECEDGLCLLRFSGRFATGADFDYLRGKLDQIQRLRSRRVLADFTEVVSIGSTGISFVIELYRIATRESGGRFVLAGANPLVRQALDLTCVSKMITVAQDVDSGLEALRA